MWQCRELKMQLLINAGSKTAGGIVTDKNRNFVFYLKFAACLQCILFFTPGFYTYSLFTVVCEQKGIKGK